MASGMVPKDLRMRFFSVKDSAIFYPILCRLLPQCRRDFLQHDEAATPQGAAAP